MHQQVITIIRNEVLRLINEQVQEIFMPLVQTPDLCNQQQQQRNLSHELIAQWTDIVTAEADKVKRSEVTFVVIGTMKSGKSTTINAIVGNELLPNRNQPMTILPTMIRHCPGQITPQLLFPNPQPFNELLEMLQQKLKATAGKGELGDLISCATTDSNILVQKILAGSFAEIGQHYRGGEDIFTALKYVNDLWRLCNTEHLTMERNTYLQHYKLQDLPAIEVEFSHLRQQHYHGSFALIDTPGPNEAGQTFLKPIIADQLEKASAVIVVLDYTQMNAEAEAEIRNCLHAIPHVTHNRLFVFVNKFDQKDRHGMDVAALRSYVATQLFAGNLAKERVFPVSSKYAYLANRALSELFVNGALSDYNVRSWVADFGQLALGACWEKEIHNIQEVTARATKLWENSLFAHPLAEVITYGSENAAIMSLKSAISKMLAYDKKMIESIQLIISALTTDMDVIENHIRCLDTDLSLMKNVQAELRTIINKGIYTLQEKFHILFKDNAKLLQEEIQLAFNLHNYEDFSTEEDARQLLVKLAGVVTTKLQLIQHQAKTNVDVVLENIWVQATHPLEFLLQTAGERLYECFAVTLDFPKPRILTDFGSDRLFPSSIRKESVTKIGTMLERRWYTLWSHDHKHTYQYRTQVYRVYSKDILALLQQAFSENSTEIWLALDEYVRTDFNEALRSYFIAAFDCLDRLKGDLLASKHNQTLQSEGLVNLQRAMAALLKTVIAHCKDVELLGKGLLIRDRKAVAAV